MSSLTKGALGVAGLGTATTGAIYFGKDLISGDNRAKTSIRELIKNVNPDKRLISGNAVTDPYWQEAWKAYREGNKSNAKDIWNVTGWTQTTGNVDIVNAPEAFINTCNSKLSEEVLDSNDPLYSQVVKYCVRDTLVSDLIGETKGKSLLVKGEGFGKDEHWKAVWKLYKQDNSSGTDKWNLNNWTSIKDQEDAQEAFASMCMEKSKVKEYKLTQPTYLDALKYCTKAE
ncbi:hypothetical protein HF1_02490 [Mycoplasma haemofelis str. Langford 1]|uniref:Uncharacterized protein n=1 Tax=Mycoplasma haemofelis (strain Langford 1) TaxID=941640 RepID=E8ZKU1_MYCHL|nr:hypothetical protein [Mycoplasma haemofelis]CBY92257.1 hypothetical protein HF1_02490 [Mycoplasma haemofelis str. Langford 1]